MIESKREEKKEGKEWTIEELTAEELEALGHS
jgi:hypothetical protein